MSVVSRLSEPFRRHQRNCRQHVSCERMYPNRPDQENESKTPNPHVGIRVPRHDWCPDYRLDHHLFTPRNRKVLDFPELPGPALGPKGPKISQKLGAGFIILSSLRSARPESLRNPGGHRLQEQIPGGTRWPPTPLLRVCVKKDPLPTSGLNRKLKSKLNFGRFSAVFRPNLAPGALQTGPARKMVQNAPNINPGDQF